MSKTLKISKHIPSVFQQSMDFSAGRTFSLSIEHSAESALFRLLAGVIVVLLLGYLYFVSASVLSVIARKEALTGITKTQSAISVMEQEYFTLSQSVTPSIGASLGLSRVRSTSYVYRPSNTVAARADIPNQGQATIRGNAI
ncbi:MAG: hypothetical protein Q8R25_04125 [bacterium]|nr:hypothetical protein [bacterium]